MTDESGLVPHPAQTGLLLTLARSGRSTNCAFAYSIDGDVDVDRLAKAYERALTEHDIFSLTLNKDCTSLVRTSEILANVVVHEVEPGSPTERNALIEGEASRHFDTSVSGLGLVQLWHSDGQPLLVTEVFDHAFVDAHGLAVLRRSVADHYHGRPVRRSQSFVDMLNERGNAAPSPATVEFWRSAFSGFPHHRDPNDTQGEPSTAIRKVSSETLARFRLACGRSRSTVASAMFAASALAQARYQGAADVFTFLPIDARAPGRVDVVGQLTFLAPVRTNHDWHKSLREHVPAVSRALAAVRSHLDMPVGDLDEAGAPIDLKDRSAAVFVYQDREPSPPDLDGVEVTVHRVPALHAAGGLTTVVRSLPDGELELDVRTAAGGAFERRAGDLADFILTVVDAVADGGALTLGSVELLPEPNRSVASRLARPRSGYPRDPVVAELVAAIDTPRPIVVGRSGTCTGHELAAMVSDYRSALGDLGVEIGDRVTVAEHATESRIAAFIAVLATGAVYVPVDPLSPSQHRDDIERLCAATARVVDGSVELVGGVEGSEYGATRNLQPGDPAYVIFTSGTTGHPKGVVVSHGAYANLLRGEADRFDIDRTSRVLLISPPTLDPWLCHVGGALLNHATLIVADPAHEDLHGVMHSERVTHAFLPAPVVATLESDLPDLEMLASAGSDYDTVAMGRFLGKRLFNIYGPTEGTVTATVELVGGGPTTAKVSIGRPIRGNGAKVLLGTGGVAPANVRGELALVGAGVALGYESATPDDDQRFQGEPEDPEGRIFLTGDRCWYDESGALFIDGRFDQQVKVRGHRFDLGHLTETAIATGGCTDAYATLTHGGALLLYVSGCRDVAAIDRALRLRLPVAWLPRQIVPVERLTYSRDDKVDLSALPSVPGGDPNALTLTDAVHFDARELLTAQWTSLTGASPASDDADFFDAGGDSLDVLRLVRAARRNGMAVTPQDVYTNSRLGDLIRVAEASDKSATPDRWVRQLGRAPLAPTQRWFRAIALAHPDRFAQHHRMRLTKATVEDVQRALAQLLDVTPILGARISESGVDATGDPETIRIHVVDDKAAISRAAVGIQEHLEPGAGRNVGAILRPDRDTVEVTLVGHHLVVDDWSWAVLEDRLRELAVVSGNVPNDDLMFRFASLVDTRTSDGAFDHDVPYWESVLARGRTSRIRSRARLLQQCNGSIRNDALAGQSDGASTIAVVLSLVGHALVEHEPGGATIIDLERNGRNTIEDLDLSDGVGWFALHHPIVVGHRPHSDDSIRTLQRELDGIRSSGLSYAALRWSGRWSAGDRIGRFAVNVVNEDVEESYTRLADDPPPILSVGRGNSLPYDGLITFRVRPSRTLVSFSFDSERLPARRAGAMLASIEAATSSRGRP